MSGNINYIQPTQPSSSQIKWSRIKYVEMQEELKGYWADDTWNPNENPLKGSNDIRGVYIYFEGLPNILKTEIKYACYQKIITKEWGWVTLHQAKATKINYLIKFLQNCENLVSSIIELEVKQWSELLTSYLIRNQIFSQREYEMITKEKKRKKYTAKDETIYTFGVLYQTIFDYYDDRDEYDKDIWDLRKLNFHLDNLVDKNKFDFTPIKQDWLRNSSKKFIKYKLALVSTSLCRFRLYALVQFSDFIEQQYSSVVPCQINRHLVLAFLSYLKSQNFTDQTHHKILTSLKDFLEICSREKWLDITGIQLFYQDDFPRYNRSRTPKYIPESVMEAINKNLEKIPERVDQRMYLILISCGMRISELCNLSMNCIKQDSSGDFFLQYYQTKMKKEITIPITREVTIIIQEQQQKTKEKYGQDVWFLFPSPRRKDRARGKQSFIKNINLLIVENNICDENGNLWHFHPHQCRHTVGTSMINNGVPHHIVQKYLGHDSPTMTQVYAHIYDQTLKKEIAKYHDIRVVNVAGEVVESTNPEIDNNLDLHILKKKVLAQSLPNGSCARPIILGECPHANACLTCGDFRTTIEFLEQHKTQLESTKKILKNAEEKDWQRHAEMNKRVKDNLEKILNTLESGNQ
ncbi:tyrosine-type recombinase/integrase [Scytonema sp. UIC 10036]|uniref:tyrosine-type recombinase/integrase n=1 Tax=Scytonema sp. UIC 10036 TaxID=2304196 RepID=UPI0012DAE059|nr:site-specific integrase [Scytonema sp. UIC 10036]MUG92598.1 tyrosine-type recombinase/integrase [Scytonema sp. UIC 10036]MUG95106.1 tyrosine-type recombinase/integrase [Scytonema sp. UIC 10036]